MANVKRGAAFCRETNCSEYGELYLVDPFVPDYVCPRCGIPGQVEPEYGAGCGRPGQPFSEVRVYYAFNGAERTYSKVAIAHEGTVFRGEAVYHLYSPVIRSPERAQRTAESILARLNQQPAKLQRGQTRAELMAEGWAVLA